MTKNEKKNKNNTVEKTDKSKSKGKSYKDFIFKAHTNARTHSSEDP